MKNATGLDMAAAFMTNIWKTSESVCNCNCIRIAMYRELPFEEHDIKPEKVVTEKQSYPLDTEEKSLI